MQWRANSVNEGGGGDRKVVARSFLQGPLHLKTYKSKMGKNNRAPFEKHFWVRHWKGVISPPFRSWLRTLVKGAFLQLPLPSLLEALYTTLMSTSPLGSPERTPWNCLQIWWGGTRPRSIVLRLRKGAEKCNRYFGCAFLGVVAKLDDSYTSFILLFFGALTFNFLVLIWERRGGVEDGGEG